MRTSSQQDKDFIANLISSTLLEEAIAYIKENFDAEEIYGKEALHDWAVDNDYIKDEN